MNLGQERLKTSSIYDVIEYIERTAKNTHDKGDMWERATLFWLRNDRQQRAQMGEVWLWDDAPTNDGHDTGIDLVAEDDTGTGLGPQRYWAIQCKDYAADNQLTLQDLSTAFMKASDSQYTHLMIVAASDNVSGKVYNAAPKYNCIVVTPEDIDQAELDWTAFLNGQELAGRKTYDPKPHQEQAIKRIMTALHDEDRCKAIMACGTGKTFMSLRLTERMCPRGLVLFGAPSIALVSQAMREWMNQFSVERLRPIVVCSDSTAGRLSEDDAVIDTLADLTFAPTTDAQTLAARVAAVRAEGPDDLVVVFSTYQSMPVVSEAQLGHGMPAFDLCICDEAHRTTGGSLKDQGLDAKAISAFQVVLHDELVHARKRLFMTATERIYGTQAKESARQKSYVLASMDDEEVYGRTAYELKFADAVEHHLLTDYRVLVLTVSEDVVPAGIQASLKDSETDELRMDDAAKIIGTYKGLLTHGTLASARALAGEGDDVERATPEFLLLDRLDEGRDTTTDEDGQVPKGVEPLHRAVGFCYSIAESKRIDKYYDQVVAAYREASPESAELLCKLDHVDGSMKARDRAKKLRWLAEGKDGHECRVLTNARCLAEGVDVPSLDAVIFFAPRKSEVDVVQAVGRVMRTFTDKRTGKEKELGYIILPVFIPAGVTPEEALNKSETFDVVWKVLQALRSHDERIEAYVNQFQLKSKRKGRHIGDSPKGGQDEGGEATGEQGILDLGWQTLADAIHEKLVDKVGSRIYWDSWAEDVARVAETHIKNIHAAIDGDKEVREAFRWFLKGLRDSLNPGISEDEAVEMVAQHMVTLPVFDALFSDFRFADSNPVSVAIQGFVEVLEERGVGRMPAEDQRNLAELYSSVRRRASIVRTDYGRQELIRDLYEQFFSKAFKPTSEKLGIVYTPVEIVDYMLHATDRALRREFGRVLSDSDVHILEPFAGTGTFPAELLADSELMPIERIRDKYLHELHCNEMLLLAYYIMVVNVEYAYHARTHGAYEPFPGAVLADTFQLGEDNNIFDMDVFSENTERANNEVQATVRAIISNPPWSVGQDNANDDNQNEHYPTLEQHIRDSYSMLSDSTNKNSLMDSYFKAFRWASDRIGDEGVICFVTNAGWLRSGAGKGVRRSFCSEFNSIYVFDLLGNQYTQGEESRRQGGKVFGSGSRASVAITMLIKNPNSEEHGVIRYHSVGEYETAEQKLAEVMTCIGQDPEWQVLSMDAHGDWLDQRDDSYYTMAPIGIMKYKDPSGLFTTWSSGLKTQRDAWCWNFSKSDVAKNVKRLVVATNTAIQNMKGNVVTLPQDSRAYSWTDAMRSYASRGTSIPFDEGNVVAGSYRPFCEQWLYYSSYLNERTYQQQRLFPLIGPNKTADNIVIALSGMNAPYPFSALAYECIPSLTPYAGNGQCLPLFWYEEDEKEDLQLIKGEKVIRAVDGTRYIRHDGITDETLAVFQAAYPTAFHDRPLREGPKGMTKKDIFWYIYGVLYMPVYRKNYATNLAKELPRVPLLRDFETVSRVGKALGKLHLGYETVEPWPSLSFSGIIPGMDPGPVEKMRWGKVRDPETGKKVDDHTTLVYNANVTVNGIPEVANAYKVNGRSPLEWAIDRYQVRTDKATGITNDPNDFSHDPCYILDLVCRLVTVSMRTTELVAQLPQSLDEVEHPANWPLAWNQETA
ncbi:MAG: type ISP restriction/modification enzyme [Olegusella sp.]|nr:type ISP restriction/modification enzyme [Olegusella sp.]